MERFEVRKTHKETLVTGDEGTVFTVRTLDEDQTAVIAARTSSMLNHHNRRESFELGHTRSYSGSCNPPGVIGSDHVEDRPKLLKVAHQAEAEAELWNRYRDQVRKALYPPSLGEIDNAPGIGRFNVTTEPEFGRIYPCNARAIPQELREALLLASAYASENLQAYLDIADACREEYRTRFAAEDAALRDEAAAQMARDLSES